MIARTVLIGSILFPLAVQAVTVAPGGSALLDPTTLPAGTPIDTMSYSRTTDVPNSPVINFTNEVFRENGTLTFVYTFSASQDVVFGDLSMPGFAGTTVDAGYVGSTNVPASIPDDPLTGRSWTSNQLVPNMERDPSGNALSMLRFAGISQAEGHPTASLVLRTDATTYSSQGVLDVFAAFTPPSPLTGVRDGTFNGADFAPVAFADAGSVPEPQALLPLALLALAFRWRGVTALQSGHE